MKTLTQKNVDFANEWGADLVVVTDDRVIEYAVKRDFKEETLIPYFGGAINIKYFDGIPKLVDVEGNILPYYSYGKEMKLIYKPLYKFVKINHVGDGLPSQAEYKGIWKSSYYSN